MNEQFLNYYVELLTSSLNDAIGKNLIFQVQKKIDSQEIESLKEKLYQKDLEDKNLQGNKERLHGMIQSLNSELEKVVKEKNQIQEQLNNTEELLKKLKNGSFGKENIKKSQKVLIQKDIENNLSNIESEKNEQKKSKLKEETKIKDNQQIKEIEKKEYPDKQEKIEYFVADTF